MSVAVVILNWNGKHFLEKFVPVLLERTRVSFQRSALGSTSIFPDTASVFVADNGSDDGSVEWLEWRYRQQEVKLIKFDRNYGFTGGYNRAFEEIRRQGGQFDYYLLLNSDVEVTDGWLTAMVTFMDTHRSAAICSPKVLWYDHPDMFEHAGACGGLMDHFYFPFCHGRMMSIVEKDTGQYDGAPAKVFWASGTSFMIRSEVWHHLGGLDEDFFAHMEEIDLCWRAQLSGWEVWVVPQSRILHVGGGTLPNNSPRKLYLNFRNNLLMLYKNLPARIRWWVIFQRRCVDMAVAAVYLVTGKTSFFKSVTMAHRDYDRMKKQMKITEATATVPRPRQWMFFTYAFRILSGR